VNSLRLKTWLAAAIVAAGCWSAQPARATGASARADGVTAWLPYWEMPAALASTIGNAEAIGTASPYWYDIAGNLRVHDESGAGSASVIAALNAHAIQLVPMVTEDAGLGAFAHILESEARRATLARELVAIAAHNGFAGVDLDFESFAYDPKHLTGPANRVAALYPVLVGQVCKALHAIGRSCQVTVMARTTSEPTYSHKDIATWVYQYGALAAVADRVQIMAYDDHSPGGPAGPIAPLPWVRQVIAYARSQADPSRYELGVPAYGYEWYGRTSADAVFARQAPALAAKVHAQPHWDADAGEETFSYRQAGHRHTVWYENAAADFERAKLAAAAGFSGVAVWAAGYEEPQLWKGLDQSWPR
jgi:spore germination protein